MENAARVAELAAGAVPVVADLNFDNAQKVKDEIEKAGGQALPIACDIRDDAAVVAAVEAGAQKFGGIDILVNNAGLAMGVDSMPQGQMSDWETMIDTNIKALVTLTRLVLPGMKAGSAAM